MKRIENEQSAQLQEVMKSFPRWITQWGWISILSVVVLIGAIGCFIRYPETVTLPIELTTVQDSAGNTRICGRMVIPASERSNIKIGQAVRIRFQTSGTARSLFADGIVSGLTPHAAGGKVVTVELIPCPPQEIPLQTTGTARIILTQKRLIETIRF